MTRGFVIAAPHSGAGKTTIASGLMRAFSDRGLQVQSFKSGPDFVDPVLHQAATGRTGQNLDLWLMEREAVRAIYLHKTSSCDLAIVEGVMGLFDGAKLADGSVSSTAEIAKTLDLPIVLVIDAKASGQSVAATALGFKKYDPDLQLAGVIANNIGSPYHAAMIEGGLQTIGLPLLGAVTRDQQLQLAEGRLGFNLTDQLQGWMEFAGQKLGQECDLDQLLLIAAHASPRPISTNLVVPNLINRFAELRIAVAYDAAFWFYYADALEWLEAIGVELVYFSPLGDQALPASVDGVIIGGGASEQHAAALSANIVMHQSLRAAVAAGMPVYAEGGGYQYLQTSLTVGETTYPMSGCVAGTTVIEQRLQAFGYRQAEPLGGTELPACKGHVYHYGRSFDQTAPSAWGLSRANQTYEREDGVDTGTVLASYLHVHFPTQPKVALAWLARCQRAKESCLVTR